MEPFLGEIRLFGFGFAPRGWALCQGQLLNINTNQALFALLGTQYGGNGTTNFALPDYRGRVPVHQTNGIPTGSTGGEEAHTLTIGEMPTHNHIVSASTSDGTSKSPAGMTWAVPVNDAFAFAEGPLDKTMSSAAIGAAGASQPHSNMQPYTTLNYCIAIQGIFPSRN